MVQKDLSFSSAIAKNDLETKIKQIAQWIEKKYHVKVTVRQAKDSNTDMVSGLLGAGPINFMTYVYLY